MEIVGVVLGCFVVGYGFTECARYVAAHRQGETSLSYPRARLVRRLLISALVLVECGVLIFLERKDGGGVETAESLAGLLALACLFVIFRLLWRDFADVREEVALARGELSRSLREGLSGDSSAASDEPRTPV